MASRAAAKKDESNVVALRKNTPSEDGIIALNLAKVKRSKEALDSANGAHRNVLKHVEAKGLNLAAAKDAISIQKSGKVEEEVAYLKALFEYLMILGAPIEKKQLDMFRVEQPRTPGVEKAREHGRYTGLMGLGHDQNPYAVDSEQGQAWLTAFGTGTDERNLIMSMESDDELISGGGDGDGDAGDETGDDENPDDNE